MSEDEVLNPEEMHRLIAHAEAGYYRTLFMCAAFTGARHVLRCGLYPALKRAKLRRVDMHSLRHFFASALIAQGAAITEVQMLLGHEDPVTTLKTYSRWFSKVKTDSVLRLAKSVLSGTWTPNGHQNPNETTAVAVSS